MATDYAGAVDKGSLTQLERADQIPADTADIVRFHGPELSTAERRKLVLKLDFVLLPVLLITYFISILDRTCVGSAVNYGFLDDLHLTGVDFNLGVSLFYILDFLCQLPSNLFLKHFSARIWLPGLALAYGTSTLGSAFVTTKAQFFVMRILLGIFGAGVIPGVSYVLATYYNRPELAYRMSFVLAASSLATAVGQLLANPMVKSGSRGHIVGKVEGWRNLFFIIGLLTLIFAVLSHFIILKTPDQTRLLTEKEREYILARNKSLNAGVNKEEATKLHLVIRAFKSPVVWFGVVPWFAGELMASSFSYFLPEILARFGWAAESAQLHSCAPFFVATAVPILFGIMSDYTRHHASFVVGSIGLGIIGLGMFAWAEGDSARYAGSFLVCITIFGATGINIAWVAGNLSPYTTKATGVAICTCVGDLGGVIGSWVFVSSEAPRYPAGCITVMAILCLSFVSTTCHYFYIRWENRQRELGHRDHRLKRSPEEVELLGSLHPAFRLAT